MHAATGKSRAALVVVASNDKTVFAGLQQSFATDSQLPCVKQHLGTVVGRKHLLDCWRLSLKLYSLGLSYRILPSKTHVIEGYMPYDKLKLYIS